jgi:hypothetical protein
MVENQHCIFERARRGIGGESVEAGTGLPQQLFDGWFDLPGLNLVERDAELKMKEWIGLTD